MNGSKVRGEVGLRAYHFSCSLAQKTGSLLSNFRGFLRASESSCFASTYESPGLAFL
jgi:hypothetical protein